jgi:AcrR family transcriptional regulator
VSAPATPTRQRGRPRSAEAGQAIFRATIELLSEHGLTGLSIEAVAARAGVAKTTIYRRWATKADLVADVMSQVPPPGPVPDTGSLQGDLAALVAIQQERMSGSALPLILPRLLADAGENPELHALLLERAVRPLREMLAQTARRSIERGELRPDIDMEALVDVLHGVSVYRILMGGGDLSRLADVPARVVPMLLRGIEPSR